MTSTAKPPLTRYHCARCGDRLREGYVFSTWTRNRYCPDLRACEKRTKRAKPSSTPSSTVTAAPEGRLF